MSHKVKYKNFKNIKNELFKISFYFQGIVNHNEANIDIIIDINYKNPKIKCTIVLY